MKKLIVYLLVLSYAGTALSKITPIPRNFSSKKAISTKASQNSPQTLKIKFSNN